MAKKIKLYDAFWRPQEGPQTYAVLCPADFVLFGGTRGGGKTECLVGRQIFGVERYQDKWQGLVIRRKYKDFAKIRQRFDELIREGLPAERIGGDNQMNYIRFKCGGQTTLAAIQRPEVANDFQGHEYTEIAFDEAPTMPFFSKIADKLKGSLRSAHGVPCRMFATGNPGGPGHNDVKEYFKLGADGLPPGTPFFDSAGESRIFIKSRLEDNKILCDSDPKYINRLTSIRDSQLRRAWLEGDWDVFLGQAFLFCDRHVIQPHEVPAGAPLYMTFDWGYAKPFSVGWWWVDEDGRFYRFGEWYGWNNTPDDGLRYTDGKIAEGIVERERSMGIWGRKITRLCDPTCHNKKPGGGMSTAEVFAPYGIRLTKGDPDRTQKIRQFRERLALPQNEYERPMMVVYSTCKHFIRTIPTLCMDEDNAEDIDTESEDHVYDEAALLCMERPMDTLRNTLRGGIDTSKMVA